MPGGDSRLALGYGLFRTAVNWGLRSPYSDTNYAYSIYTGGSVAATMSTARTLRPAPL